MPSWGAAAPGSWLATRSRLAMIADVVRFLATTGWTGRGYTKAQEASQARCVSKRKEALQTDEGGRGARELKSKARRRTTDRPTDVTDHKVEGVGCECGGRTNVAGPPSSSQPILLVASVKNNSRERNLGRSRAVAYWNPRRNLVPLVPLVPWDAG